MRLPSQPGENNWAGSIKAGGGTKEGPDTREVRDTLAGTGLSLSICFRSPGSSPSLRS